MFSKYKVTTVETAEPGRLTACKCGGMWLGCGTVGPDNRIDVECSGCGDRRQSSPDGWISIARGSGQTSNFTFPTKGESRQEYSARLAVAGSVENKGDSLIFSIDGAPVETVTFDAVVGMKEAIERANKALASTKMPRVKVVTPPKEKRSPSRHQARLEKHAARRPLPGDKRAKPEGKGRRWFWPLVAAFLMLVSGVAGAITIADKWPLF